MNMVRKCDPYFTLERKIRRFLSMSMSAFHVPGEERERIIPLWWRSTCAPRRGR